jgi:hypothetical protein
MSDKKYSIFFRYNLSTSEYEEKSKEIFLELTRRKLEFTCEEGNGNNPLAAVRVYTNYNNIEQAFSVLKGDEELMLTKKLDRIVLSNK